MSVLKDLREITPPRPLSDAEARGIAERQAARFLRLSGIAEPHVPGSIIADLPRITVEVRSGLPESGVSFWDNQVKLWRIWLRAQDVAVRQRFSLAHELKHVIDNDVIDFAYPPLGLLSSRKRAEAVCDYFAACLLMPRPWVKRAWGLGIQQVDALAELFGVSGEAMARRLSDLGLRESPYRHMYYRVDPQIEVLDTPTLYFRSASTGNVEGVAA